MKKYNAFEINIDTLGYYVNRAFFALIKLLNKEIKESGLKFQHSDFVILKILITIGGASQSQIANILGKERSAISRSLASLEEEGYILREQVDGKTNLVTLSEKGKEIVPLINDIGNRVSELGFKGLSKRSRESMINNLTKIFDNAISNMES